MIPSIFGSHHIKHNPAFRELDSAAQASCCAMSMLHILLEAHGGMLLLLLEVRGCTCAHPDTQPALPDSGLRDGCVV